MEDGWRQNSPSKVNQAFGKASYRGDKLDLNLSTLLVKTELVGNGLLPSEMYAQDPTSIFTAPDTTDNTLAQFQLSGAFQVNDNFSVTGQVYRRNSKRHQVGADVFTDWDEELVAKRLPNAGEQYTCLMNSTNQYGLPDYYVIPVANYVQGERDLFFDSVSGGVLSQFLTDYSSLSSGDFHNAYVSNFNTALPEDFRNALQYQFENFRNFRETNVYNRNVPVVPLAGQPNSSYFNEESYNANSSIFAGNFDSGGLPVLVDSAVYFFTESAGVITKNYVVMQPMTNEANCLASHSGAGWDIPDPTNPSGVQHVDGGGFGQPGIVSVIDPVTGKPYYTPTAVLTDNQIDQMTDGFSLQFNWNLDKHKLMAGVSVDSASADYTNEQRLGLLDANRNAYLAPDQIHPMFAGAFIPISNNNFEGDQTTKSLYFSETWSPVETLHLSASGRYNATHGKNKIAARHGLAAYGIGDVIGLPDEYNVCPNGDCTNVPTGYRTPRIHNALNPAETEKFSYFSFNPSLGATWQARENLNLYANWAKGTRVPSVIELGCAFDDTPVFVGGDPNDPRNYTPRSLHENRQCTLPTTLSGDPYLPQIMATTYEVGTRGALGESLQWNLGAFETDLKDDIYFVSVGNGMGFFDTVGKTRRRGVEAGLSGKHGKWGFGLNYALTDATFQEDFLMMSRDNSSSFNLSGYGEVIKVKPGNRMPGVPLHNLNASVSYEVSDKWTIGLSAVAHSESYVRGNENNQHRVGVVQYRDVFYPGIGSVKVARQPTANPGTVAGYMVLNFQTSYKFNKEWTASLLVNNVLDKEYFTAGRLGRNPFSPSIQGAIGPDGYNHNSSDWVSTNFIAPGAPRGIWATLRYEFAPDNK